MSKICTNPNLNLHKCSGLYFLFYGQKLKKRLLMTTMTLSDLKNPYAELQMEGAIEEIRKDRRVYQKRWKLNFRSVWNMKATKNSDDSGDCSRNKSLTLSTVLYYVISISVFSYVFASSNRQPFKFLPQSLILQETFTSDLHQKVYTLESKVLVHGNKKAIHILTLGFQPQQPYVSLNFFNTLCYD